MFLARAKGKLKGKQPQLSARQQAELCRMHATDEYTIADLAEVFPEFLRPGKAGFLVWPTQVCCFGLRVWRDRNCGPKIDQRVRLRR